MPESLPPTLNQWVDLRLREVSAQFARHLASCGGNEEGTVFVVRDAADPPPFGHIARVALYTCGRATLWKWESRRHGGVALFLTLDEAVTWELWESTNPTHPPNVEPLATWRRP